MEHLVQLVLRLLMLLFFSMPTEPEPQFTPTPAPQTFRASHVIEYAEPRIIQANPLQVQLYVRGYQGDGCVYPVRADQYLNGGNLTVAIYRELSVAVSCLQTIIPYEALIPLRGLLPNQTYTINVNGYITQVVTPGDPAPARVNTVIESVQPQTREAVPAQIQLVIRGYQPDSCEYPVQVYQRRAQNNVFVDIYRELPANVRCAQAVVPYEQTILIDGSFADGTYNFYVNGFATSFTVQNPPPVGRVQASIGSVVPQVLESFPAQVQVQVTGYHADGCQYPTQVAQSRNGSVVSVSVYREVPGGVMCPPQEFPFQQTILLDGTFEPGKYTVEVNGVAVAFEVGGQPVPAARIATVVDSVTPAVLESLPAQIQLQIFGYQPDGCQYPVQLTQSRNGNNVSVAIWREVPGDVMCPQQIVPYSTTLTLDGTFEPGTYTIEVNGVATSVTI